MDRQQTRSSTEKAFKIYSTILEIMEARGYAVSEESKDITYKQFCEMQANSTRDKQVFQHLESEEMESETDNSIAVFYNFREEKITEEYIKKMIQTTSKVKKFFLVVPSIEKGKAKIMNIDKKALTFVQELGRKDRDETIQPIRIELFMDDDLLYNVLKHDLVPEHKLLSETEKKQLMLRYKVKETQLPKILVVDPVAKLLGLRRGQVVKITRKSETAGTYTTYRIAI